MISQIAALFALVAVACAAPTPGGVVAAAPAVYAAAPAVYSAAVPVPQTVAVTGTNGREIYRAQDGLGNYASGYSVSDSLTGDHKSSHDEQVGGGRVGSYSQLSPNGYEQRTEYVADALGTRSVTIGSENGLYVNGLAHSIQPNAVPAVAPVAAYNAAPVAAPMAAYNAAPIAAHAVAAPAVAAYSTPAIAAHHAVAAPAVAYGGLGGVAYGGLGGLGYAGFDGLGYAGLGGLGYAAGPLAHAGYGLGYSAAPLAHGYGLGYGAAPVAVGHHGGLIL